MNSDKKNYFTYAEIDLKAIRHNLKQIRLLADRTHFYLPFRNGSKKNSSKTEVLAVIKADAYGHGMEEVAVLLDKSNVEFFGVSDVDEGLRLRKAGIEKPILLFESTLANSAKEIILNKLTPTLGNYSLAKALNSYAQKENMIVDVHVSVDTGMGRLGIWHENAFDFIKSLMKLKRLRIMGIMTHFPAADTDKSFTRKQIKCLYDLVSRLDKSGLVIPYIHAANSMGLIGYKSHVLNLARTGLMLYGLYPYPSLKKAVKLRPALSVKSKVVFIKHVKKGQSISYGRTFFTKKDMVIAVIPLGYYDGYFRALSNKAVVLISGVRCPVVGRVTMDQTMVDVTDVKGVKIGSPVIVLGSQKKEVISADELARYASTINYEIVCNLGNLLPRIYK